MKRYQSKQADVSKQQYNRPPPDRHANGEPRNRSAGFVDVGASLLPKVCEVTELIRDSVVQASIRGYSSAFARALNDYFPLLDR